MRFQVFNALNMNNDLTKRKHPRLKEYDYSQNGYYFITICCHEKKNFFGSVGRGLAPAEKVIKLSERGKIAKKQLFALEKKYSFVQIDKYVVMPNHIHAIIIIENSVTAGASPRPTLMDVVCTYKSIVTRQCNAICNNKGRKIFQTSFYEEVLRDDNDYLQVWQYIDENPRKWKNDEYYK